MRDGIGILMLRTRDCGEGRKEGGVKNRAEGLEEAHQIFLSLRRRIDEETVDYVRSTPLCFYEVDGKPLSLDIRDLLLVGAITESDVLLTGKTGEGKTKLAVGVMRALFGPEGYYAKTTLPTMNPSEFMDIDFPAIVEGRKTLREALSGVSALEKPGIVLNEVNRAPGVIQALLIAFLDRELEVQGVPVAMGRPWENGRYQFRILTINEGGIYRVEEIDPAVRDRMTIEIPVDAFPRTKKDLVELLSVPRRDRYAAVFEEHAGEEQSDLFPRVIAMRRLVEEVPVQPDVLYFLGYLSGLSYCVRTPRGNKELVHLGPDLCEGCHHAAAFYGLCGNILAPSARGILALLQVAKAFALVRTCKTAPARHAARPVFVTIQDIIAAAPFVLYSKLNINPLWVRTAGDRTTRFYGDRWTAIQSILAWIYRERFLRLMNPQGRIGSLLLRYSEGHDLTQSNWEEIYRYLMERDPWAFDPSMVRAMIKADEQERAKS